MANYKAKAPIIATLTEGSSGATYSNGLAVGKLIEVGLTVNFNEGSLYGDDGLAEYVKEFKDVDITLQTTTIPHAARVAMFGETVPTSGSTTGEYSDTTDDISPYVGFGFVVGEMVDNTVKYQMVWFPKVKFSLPSDTYTTKGDSVSFGTPSISGKGIALSKTWREVKTFSTEDAALEALKTKAGISE